jgi:hypothetical protein
MPSRTLRGLSRRSTMGQSPEEVAMKPKRLLLPVGIVLAVALAVGMALDTAPAPWPTYRLTKDAADAIHEGMTEAEVVKLMGRPPGNYASPDVSFIDACPDYKSDVWGRPEGRPWPGGKTEKAWVSDVGGVAVVFDPEGRVEYSYFEPMHVPKRSLLAWMLRRIGRRLFG